MKVYGLTVFAPLHWPIEVADNGSRQVRVVAAVRSKQALIELLRSHGINMTHHGLKWTCSVTGNAAEIAAAERHPGELLRHAGDRTSRDVEPVPAERKSS